jgi:large subunit ribosomal protein L3
VFSRSGKRGEEITPKGGFLNYGDIRNNYVLIHGSVPGPTKRLIRLRDPVRPNGTMLKEAPNITYVSIQSKQGA